MRLNSRDTVHTTAGQQLVAAGYDRPLHVRKAVAARDDLRDAINLTIVATKTALPHERILVDLAAGSRWLLTQLDPSPPAPTASAQRSARRPRTTAP